jgi:hypothetical protein
MIAGLPAGSEQPDSGSWQEDRANHVYSCLYEGSGPRIPICLTPPDNGSSSGSLALALELLPVATPSVKARQQAAAQAQDTCATGSLKGAAFTARMEWSNLDP